MTRRRRAALVLPAMAAILLAGCGVPQQGPDPGDEPPAVPPPDPNGPGASPPASPPPPPGQPTPPPPPPGAFPPRVRLERVLDGLDSPLLVTHAGDGSQRLFVVEQDGTIRTTIEGEMDPRPYLDIRNRVRSGGEQGLLGLAFAPDFATTGRLFVSYTDLDGDTVVERLTVAEPLAGRPDPDAATVVLTQDQPYPNHNGGHLAFGPDGYLYFGLGDGGSGGDPHGNAQNLDTWLGKMLRLDASGPIFTAPADNPFVGREGRDEIWAYGLRNPWRFSFDRATGDLFIGDVGQGAWEEIDWQAAYAGGGQNYGWDQYEGNHDFDRPGGREGLTFPILEYARTGGHCSVTGGHVYRGQSVPQLQGLYVYGDYCSGFVWAARQAPNGWESAALLDTDHRISSFGEDEDGELYLVDHGGSVHRFQPG